MSEISVCYFSCFDCKTVLPVPDRVLESDGFFFNCSFCSRPISLRNIYRNESLEIVEAFGCNYGGKEVPREAPPSKKTLTHEVGAWINDSVSQANYNLESGLDDFAESSIVEGSASKWEVETRDGQHLRFEFFAEIRRAVLDGKIHQGDFIVSLEGKKHPIEDYPGTADLFGNQYSKEKIGLGEIPEWKPVSRGGRKIVERVAITVLSIGTVAGLYLGYPFALDFIRTQRGKALIQGMVEQPSSGIIPSPSALRAQTAAALQAPEITALTELAEKLSAAIGKNPQDAGLISALAQVWTEIGWLKHDPSYFARAGQLACVVAKIQPGSVDHALALGRALWREGRVQEAIAALQAPSESTGEGYFILGQLWDSVQDPTRAILNYSQAYKKDPSNPKYVTALVDRYEQSAKYTEAAAFLRKAIESDPSQTAFTERLLSIYKKASDFQSLEDYYRDRIAAGEKADIHHRALIAMFDEQRKYAAVNQESATFLSRYPESPWVKEVLRMQQNAQEQLRPPPAEDANPDTAPRRTRVRRRR